MDIELLKNRTSTVPPAKTAGKIEELLGQAGASHIVKSYDNGQLCGIEFVINTPHGAIQFRMPVNVEAAYQVLSGASKRGVTRVQRERLREQAARTAWKLCLEDVELQLSKVTLRQAELTQALLPYVVRNGITLFEAMRADSYKFLIAAPTNETPTQEIIDG